MDASEKVTALLQLAVEAGERILAFYKQDFDVVQKADGSPVTAADAAAEAVIQAGLSEICPSVAVVAEEAVEAGMLPAGTNRYFLVDPLDGTKEFLKKNGEFTVNIALIDDTKPVFGVVYAPALGDIYWGGRLPADLDPAAVTADQGAYQARVAGGDIVSAQRIAVRTPPGDGISVVASRSHLSAETDRLIDQFDVAECLSIGSSLKLCLVASGRADLYPRMAPTMQWDIAAGDAVVRSAGGHVVRAGTHEAFEYVLPDHPSKDDLRNGHFIALSDLALLRRPDT